MIDAVFHMPDKLYDLILDVYRDSLTANFIFKSFILKPISLKLDNNITVDELYEVARNGAEKLKDILAKGGIDTCKMCKSDNSNKTCEKV
ncbi:MAG: hypothetical protein F7B60_05915 [Desulfurococcales archaeon]|nr:hypothetical protein [Desulfurococcales archaeon]